MIKHNNWFTIKHIHPRVYSLAEFHHFEQVVSYLFIGDREAVLFDTGMGYADILEEVRLLTSLPVHVFFTHGHWDHTGGASLFSKVSIANHRFEMNLLARGFESVEIPELHDPGLFRDPFLPKKYDASGVSSFTTLRGGQIIKSGSYSIKVLQTPGHTPGSLCFFILEENLLFVGDTVYPGPLYAHLPESSLTDYTQSMKALKHEANDQTVVFPGHNEVKASFRLIEDISEAFDLIVSGWLRGDIADTVTTYTCNEFSILVKTSELH